MTDCDRPQGFDAPATPEVADPSTDIAPDDEERVRAAEEKEAASKSTDSETGETR